jgi:hypothetical protein
VRFRLHLDAFFRLGAAVIPALEGLFAQDPYPHILALNGIFHGLVRGKVRGKARLPPRRESVIDYSSI